MDLALEGMSVVIFVKISLQRVLKGSVEEDVYI